MTISRDRRHELLSGQDTPKKPSELSYLICEMCAQYLFFADKKDDQTFNDIIGAIEKAKLEIWYRHFIPFENQKRNEYGEKE